MTKPGPSDAVLRARPAFAAFGLVPGASPAAVRDMYRKKAASAHPDAGGSAEAFNRLTAALSEAMRYATDEPCPACGGTGRRVTRKSFSAVALDCPECAARPGFRHARVF